MREIKFRGMKNNGDWVYGGITSAAHSPKNKIQIVSARFYEGHEEHEHFIFINVKEETVGQYTGLEDKSGNGIFEDDIIQTETGAIGVIKFAGGGFVCGIAANAFSKYPRIDSIEYAVEAGIKVIGNIYQNPELLK